jgi:carbamoyl-phosphate synthase small subunit
VLVSTASHVGNTGFTNEDMESGRIWAEGLVCRNLEGEPSNWRSKKPLGDWIVDEKRFAVSGIDTRQLTSLLREEGSQRGVVVTAGSMTPDQAKAYIQKSVPDMKGRDLTGDVSCAQTFVYQAPKAGYWPYFLPAELSSKEARPLKVAVWDFGVKTNTLRALASQGAEVHVLPATTKAEDFLDPRWNGILLSNGPGDPAAATHVIAELKKILGKVPLFAICLGHQLVGHAAGAKTYKMKFGHRGIHHPVMELDASGKSLRTWITSQNHGFALDAQTLPKNVRVSFLHADDESVEGLSLPELRCETVQFHPEASPGPYDAGLLLRQFTARLRDA